MLLLNKSMENKCCEIIENEIDIYFVSCMKSAYAFSVLAVNDIKKYDYETFEKLVLSEQEVQSLVKGIVSKVNRIIENDITDDFSLEACTSTGCFCGIKSVLDGTMDTFKTSQNVAKLCERLINRSVEKFCKSLIPIPMANKALGKLKLGSRLLGDLSLNEQMQRQQELVYKQVQGLLINTKTDLKNYLEEYVNTTLSSIEEKRVLGFHAIA